MKWHRIIIPRPQAGVSQEMVERYLPGNYRIMAEQADRWIVEGKDRDAWTAEFYVLPSLASGLITARIER